MRYRKSVAVGILCILPTTSSCGFDGDTGSHASGLPAYPVTPEVTIDSPVFERAKRAGKIVIGSKDDQPFLASVDADGNRSGFDIEVARMVAADLGFSADQIEFRTVRSDARERAIARGDVDLYVGTYTMSAERMKKVDFAGPYHMAGADLLVRMTEMQIDGPQAVQGKKVCSVSGSTSLQEIKKPNYGATAVELQSYPECVRQLLDEKVDAVTTDDAILLGYAAQHLLKIRVVGAPFTKEPYGIGMKKGDQALRDAVNDALEVHRDNGDIKEAFLATLGRSGSSYREPPPLENYP
ncbi:glutamate ABC transporter substrate-binding protein [Streptomyces sp. WMMC940]|uniref:glutamate ABC transporter substrate-binding protein n=1 Tax=Streptomyces sp. WMMC940 TaxID=3015153 RepID=UPI0022B669D7|nr:glutamate ABC transporter substrate-binding protein [Streptomyces sp. WMMC940]MCZ7456287.1 glutamate ABC transporter substrate-binding protein [Streptomyces sp. WMMC940]